MIGEHRDLVCATVPVGVLEDLDTIVAGISVEHFVGIIHRLDDPQTAAFIEGERDRQYSGLGFAP